MTPGMYYIKLSKRKKRYANNFYNHPVVHNNLTKYHELNHITPPSKEDIKEVHLAVIRIHQMNYLKTGNILNKVVANVNADFYNPLAQFHDDIELGINLIDDALNRHLTNQDFQENPINVKALLEEEKKDCIKDINKYKKVVSKLKDLYHYLSTSNLINDEKIKKYVTIIDTGISELKSSIASYSGTGSVLPASAIISGGYLYDLAWLRYRLQGRYYEVMGINYFGEKLIKTTRKYRIVDTANASDFHFDIFGNNKGLHFSQSDALILDAAVKIEVNGKIMTIGQYLDQIQLESGQKTIAPVLSTEQLAIIKKGLVAGMQIKSGKNQSVFNQKKITLNDIITANVVGNKYARALQLLSNLVTTSEHSHPHFYPTHEHYDALFNYCLAKHLNWVIGKENVIVFTRNGCQTIYDYMLDQYANNRFIRVINSVNIQHPNKELVIDQKKY